jgi:peptidase E
MTKFILNGGFNRESLDKNNDEFYREILNSAKDNSRVLLVFFAKETDRLDEASKRVIGEFSKNAAGKNLTFEIATEQDFINQIENADVIYFAGGKTLLLLEVLKKFPNLKDFLKGKIIAGESAGANAWSHYCYSPNADKVVRGLGILPIKVIPHYQEIYKGKLDNVDADLKLVLLEEYQTATFEV